MRKNNIIRIRVTKEEYLKIKRIANEKGITMTDYLRILLFSDNNQKW